MVEPSVLMEGVRVWAADGTMILDGIDWRVEPGHHWALIGPNGSGKSTLLSLAGAARHPSDGSVTVLGGRLGRISLWDLRERIGALDPALRLYDWFTVEEVVLTGLTGTVQPRWDCYGPADQVRAAGLLELLGCGDLLQREIATCSQGERQRIRIARALMANPPLLLLDEPSTGLDLPAREALMIALADLAERSPSLTTILVSHHLEELPVSTSHALLLRAGRSVAQGEVAQVLTSARVSKCFDFPVEVRREAGRWSARASGGWRRAPAGRYIESIA